MEISDTVWDLVNMRRVTSGFLATADADGNCNVALYGSLQLSDRSTMTMTMGDTRSLSNLKENPNAAFVVAAGEGLEDVAGCRLYLKVRQIVEEGPVLEKGRMLVAQAAGEQAASMMKAFITFDVADVRPLVDMGQGVD